MIAFRNAAADSARQPPIASITAVLLAMLAPGGAQAFDIDSGSPDLRLNWDTTAKASLKARVEKADPALADSFRELAPGVLFPQALDFNNGDQNFQKRGLVSERIDLFTEVDAIWRKDFGVRLSAAGWYDAEYSHGTDATDAFVQQTPINEFPARTRSIAGHKAEMLDWFVFGGMRLDNGIKLTGRLGSHALQYGESLFFGDNGIARAQGPIDIDKLLASPNAQFKEIIRPVPQVSAQAQLTPTIALGGYYQFRWQADRLPPAGSYFSSANIPWGSEQPQFFAGSPSFLLLPGGDVKPRNSGQYGMQLKWRVGEVDLGFYAARFHDKDGQFYDNLNPAGAPNAAGALPGSWFYVFPESVKTAGASATYSIGDFNLAAEASIRSNMPLRSQPIAYAGGIGQPMPRYATGRTAHLNFSWLASLGPSFIANEASFLGEIAWNRALSVNDPDHQLEAFRSRDATALRLLYTPSYRQALAGVDINVPLGLGITLDGNSSVTQWGSRGTGDASIGVEGVYLDAWRVALNYTQFIGKAQPTVDYSRLATGGPIAYGQGNPFADRNYVSLTLRHTF